MLAAIEQGIAGRCHVKASADSSSGGRWARPMAAHGPRLVATPLTKSPKQRVTARSRRNSGAS
jgi:hypothetical protein